MELKKPAVAGTLESSDVQVTLRPNPGKGIQISLTSDVKALFGQAIEATAGFFSSMFSPPLPRMQCAVCRAAEIRFDWGKEDPNG